MRIVIAGASGLIGTELRRQLAARGDEVVRLVRRPAGDTGEATWDPASGLLDPAVLEAADAVVNLAGASIGRLPWTRSRKAEILSSRVDATATIVRALHAASASRAAGAPVPALVNASAVGYYGSRPGERLTESSDAGDGFLAEVVRRWEEAALAAPEGTRVALARTGVVIGDGGAIRPLRLLAKLGLAGPLGTGRQHWPWISLRDEAAALIHLIDHELSGPVNLAGPTPATAGELARTIARSLNARTGSRLRRRCSRSRSARRRVRCSWPTSSRCRSGCSRRASASATRPSPMRSRSSGCGSAAAPATASRRRLGRSADPRPPGRARRGRRRPGCTPR